jgi:hypothetical protein
MSDLIDSEKCRRNLECGVCSALISENPENARTRSHSFPEFSYIEDCVENKIQFTRKIPHGVTTKSMLLQAFFNKRYFATLTYVFYLRYSSNWNPHRLHSEPFPPKKKHNVGPSASTTITTTLVSVLRRFEYLAERSNILDHYMFKEAI